MMSLLYAQYSAFIASTEEEEDTAVLHTARLL